MLRVSSLLARLLLIMAALFTLLGGVFLLVERGILLPSYEELEKRQVEANVNRVANALHVELEHLDRVVLDWSAWDDTYAYVIDRNAAFEQGNLQENTFEINNINVLGILDLEGTFVWVKAYDPLHGKRLEINGFSGKNLAVQPLLEALAKSSEPLAKQHRQGLLATSAGPLLLSVRPVTDSDMHAPPRGYLLMGRLLTAEVIADLAKQTETQLQLLALAGDGTLPNGGERQAPPAPGEIAYQIDGDRIIGCKTLAGVDGTQVLLTKVTMPRTILEQGRETVRIAFGLFGLGVIACMLGATLLLKRAVIEPVRRLTGEVLALRRGEKPRTVFKGLSASREVMTLGREFESLVAELEEKNAYLADLNRQLLRDTEKLKEAERRLTQFDQLKNEFISTAAHELRTPLASIMGYTELLAEPAEFGPFSAEQKQDFLGEIYDNGERLTRIVDSILDVSRIESGQPLPLYKELIDLPKLLERIVARFRLQAPRHELSLELADGIPPLAIDPFRITQVMENLLSNAIKYSPGGGSVQVSVTSREGQCVITVADQGIGMTPEQLDKVFEKFYRADGSNTAIRGLGLGMSIARQIVAEHDGFIQVASEYGKGTTVTMTLPFPLTASAANPLSGQE